MKKFYLYFLGIFVIGLLNNTRAEVLTTLVHDDTVRALNVNNVPVIDGMADDAAWNSAEWQSIDQMWITWGEPLLDSTDFFGRYKVVWSSEENLLYFLVEVNDDFFADGYVWSESTTGYHNFDIVELFIDEDRSGGLHVFDGTGDFGEKWGTNAENAFSYHIMVDQPADQDTNSSFVVCDIAGTDWGYPDQIIPNYADHFPELVLFRDGDYYTWEFSLKVFDDSYDPKKTNNEPVELSAGKIMGLSLAYCENDQDDEQRDNFIGSVAVTQEAHNDHWKRADDYGVLKLVEGNGVKVNTINNTIKLQVFQDENNLFIRQNDPWSAGTTINVFNILGKMVLYKQLKDDIFIMDERFNVIGLEPGIYIINIQSGRKSIVKKIFIN
ncbi:MAG: sugar-binding protein [Bacteroidota bacterium]